MYKELTPGMMLSACAKSGVLIYRADGSCFNVPYANITQGKFVMLTDDDFIVLDTKDGRLYLYSGYFTWIDLTTMQLVA